LLPVTAVPVVASALPVRGDGVAAGGVSSAANAGAAQRRPGPPEPMPARAPGSNILFRLAGSPAPAAQQLS